MTKAAAAKILSVEQIERADDSGTETIEIPEWGGSVKIRGLTRGEARQLSELDVAEAEVLALSVAMVEPAVSKEKAAELLEQKTFGATERILARILELSGLGAGFRA